MRIVCAVALSVIVSSASLAADSSLTNPDWLKRPTADELRAVWPAEAAKRGVNGNATISCKISLEGRPFDCSVINETPKDMGFGSAAIALTPQLLFRPATRDGTPIVSTVRIPVNFSGLSPGASARPERGDYVITALDWEAAPSFTDVASVYPRKAREARASGTLMLACKIAKDGRPHLCAVVNESPKGMGFGAAAKQLTSKFRAPAALPDGDALAGMGVHIPVTFSASSLEGTPRIGKPRWKAFPEGQTLQSALPVLAKGTTVRVVLDCAAAADGFFTDCLIDSETPSDLGVGAAVLSLASHMRINLWTDEGLPIVGGRLKAPIRYTVE